MTNRKPGLSRDAHTELGMELAEMRDRLGKIAVQLGHAYPKPVADIAVRAQGEIDRLRSTLDNIVFCEYPNFSTNANISVYYGRSDDAK